MNAILVGGAGDGTKIVLPDGTTRYDSVVQNKTDTHWGMTPERTEYEVQHYNLFRLHPVTRAVIFAHEDLTPTQIMERLLECYRPAAPESFASLVEEFVGWWELNRDGSVNRAYNYVDKFVKRTREALS